MKCPNCGAKYKGRKCPECGRHTDPSMEAQRNTKIALLVIALVIVAVIAYHLIASILYYNGLMDALNDVLHN